MSLARCFHFSPHFPQVFLGEGQYLGGKEDPSSQTCACFLGNQSHKAGSGERPSLLRRKWGKSGLGLVQVTREPTKCGESRTFLLCRSTTCHTKRISSLSSEPSLAPYAPAVAPNKTTTESLCEEAVMTTGGSSYNQKQQVKTKRERENKKIRQKEKGREKDPHTNPTTHTQKPHK